MDKGLVGAIPPGDRAGILVEQPVFKLQVAGEVQVALSERRVLAGQALRMPGLQRRQGAHRIERETEGNRQAKREQQDDSPKGPAQRVLRSRGREVNEG